MIKPKSLKSNIMIYFIIFTIIPLVIGSFITLTQMYKSKENSILIKHKQILNQVITESDSIITEIEELANYIENRYPKVKNHVLSDVLNIQKNITSILILDNDGILKDFVSTINLNMHKGYDYSNKEYFIALKNGHNCHWTDIYLSSSLNNPSVAYSKRISKNRILALVIDLSTINEFAKKFKSEDNTSMVRIIDKNGVFLAHPDNFELVEQRRSIHNDSLYKNHISKNHNDKQIIFHGKSGLKNIGIYTSSNELSWTVIVKEEYDFIFGDFNRLIMLMIFLVFVLINISIYASLKLSKSILQPLDDLSKNMDEVAHGENVKEINVASYKELKQLSNNFLLMENKIKDREEQNRLKDLKINENSKMVQMGEMIGNIAHQWRQPLSAISTSASGMKLEKEYGLLTDDKLNKHCDTIVDSTVYLSDTIDTFRNFIKDEKKLEVTTIQKKIDDILKIVSAMLGNNHIELINNIDYENEIKIKMISGELSQVIINLINNAKDALLEKSTNDNNWIKINCGIKNSIAFITVEDNAGGIPEEIINKIYDPYFTTKHKSQGTGLGLHMSRRIVIESLQGELYCKNTKDGVVFTVEIPDNLDDNQI